MKYPRFNVGQIVEVLYAEGDGTACTFDGVLARIMKRQYNMDVPDDPDNQNRHESWTYLVKFISDGCFGKCMEEDLRRHIERYEQEVQWEDLSSKSDKSVLDQNSVSVN